MDDDVEPETGWWVIRAADLLAMLRRAADGDDPDLLYAEAYANARHDHPSA